MKSLNFKVAVPQNLKPQLKRNFVESQAEKLSLKKKKKDTS